MRNKPTPTSTEDRAAMATSVNNSLSYIRNYYGVPAQLKGRVLYTYRNRNQLGTIVGTSGASLMILLDGERRPAPYHPTWELRYLIEVDRRTDRHGETWTRTANRKPWRGMGGVDLTGEELDARGPLTDTSYVITTWPTSSMTGNGVDRARTEVLWSNRPIGVEPDLFDQLSMTTGWKPDGGDVR